MAGVGYGGDVRWTQNEITNTVDTADWRPTIPVTGVYEVLVQFPVINNGFADTQRARYQVSHAAGVTLKEVVQYNRQNTWQSLGWYVFNAGTAGSLRLRDDTGETRLTRALVADVAKFLPRRDLYKAELITHTLPISIGVGARQTVQLVVKNSGSVTWTNGTYLAPVNPRDPISHTFFDTPTWVSPARIQTSGAVKPGDPKTFTFGLQAPATPGRYQIGLNLTQEGFAWFTVPGDSAWSFPIDVIGGPTSPLTPTVPLTETVVPQPGSCAITINNGRLFTNQRAVTISSEVAGAQEMQLSNDGGFSGARWQPFAAVNGWTLSDPGMRLASLLVYARFRAGDTIICNWIDDVLYDPLAPTVVVTQVGSVRTSATVEEEPPVEILITAEITVETPITPPITAETPITSEITS